MADVLDIARIEKELQEINQQRSEVCRQTSSVAEEGHTLGQQQGSTLLLGSTWCDQRLSVPCGCLYTADLQTRERLDAMRGGRGRGRGPPGGRGDGGVFSRLGVSAMNGGERQHGLCY
jgi:hypothetical protein